MVVAPVVSGAELLPARVCPTCCLRTSVFDGPTTLRPRALNPDRPRRSSRGTTARESVVLAGLYTRVVAHTSRSGSPAPRSPRSSRFNCPIGTLRPLLPTATNIGIRPPVRRPSGPRRIPAITGKVVVLVRRRCSVNGAARTSPALGRPLLEAGPAPSHPLAGGSRPRPTAGASRCAPDFVGNNLATLPRVEDVRVRLLRGPTPADDGGESVGPARKSVGLAPAYAGGRISPPSDSPGLPAAHGEHSDSRHPDLAPGISKRSQIDLTGFFVEWGNIARSRQVRRCAARPSCPSSYEDFHALPRAFSFENRARKAASAPRPWDLPRVHVRR